jgi:hypothetical protein
LFGLWALGPGQKEKKEAGKLRASSSSNLQPL